MKLRRERCVEGDPVTGKPKGEARPNRLQRPGENGYLTKPNAIEPQRGDLARDPVGFLGGVPEGATDELGRLLTSSVQVLPEVCIDVAPDDAGCQIDDRRRAAVVGG